MKTESTEHLKPRSQYADDAAGMATAASPEGPPIKLVSFETDQPAAQGEAEHEGLPKRSVSNEPTPEVASYDLVVITTDHSCVDYAKVVRELRRRGELIGTNDLWIGCASLRLGIPIVTANVEHFRRIDGLGIVQYR